MKKIFTLILGFVFIAVSCTDEYDNPSTASEDQVVSDVNGLIYLVNGLQYKYSVTQLSPGYTVPSASGLLTGELTVLNAGNTNELQLSQGGNSIQGNNSILTNLWNQSNLVKSNADLILKNLGIVQDQGTKGAIQAHASIFKALALGNLAMFWEQAPIVVGKNADFVSRQEVLGEAIIVLESARTELAKAPVPASFSASVPTGIDYVNTINALIARYALMAGDYDKALTAANLVSLSATARMNHDEVAPNALHFSSFAARNNTEPVNNQFSLPVALQTNPSDKRINFFFSNTVGVNRGKAGFFASNATAVPIYRPGEVILIKAEAHVRKASPDLTAAVTELDRVLTKAPGADALGIGAELTAYSGAATADAILEEIYKQRCIELYLSGLRFDDSRRFGRPISERAGRNFLPYPFSERDNNVNTPPDPAF